MKKKNKTLYDNKLVLSVNSEEVVMISSTENKDDIALLIGNALSELCHERGWATDDFMDVVRYGADLTEEISYGE